MARVHLFELEDLQWCPSTIREAATDYLLGLYNVLHIYEPAYQKVYEVLKITNTNELVDCCSGSGGPLPKLREYLDKTDKANVTITLSDLYPNQGAYQALEKKFPGKIKGCMTSIDASNFPSHLKGMRTFFSSFHHFRPEQAQKMLQDAVNNGVPIGIFECTQRRYPDFLRTLVSPLMALFLIPLAGRMDWKKFIFTYLIPITPFTFMWDYLVSNLRTYSKEELTALIQKLDAPGYHWEMGTLWAKTAMCEVPYMIGYKKT